MVMFQQKLSKTKAESSSAFLDEQQKVKKDSQQKQKKQKVKASFASIAPIVDISNNEYLEMASGEYLEILQITSKDIYSLNEGDRYNDIDNLGNFFIGYSEDLKIVPLNMPMQLEEQKRHLLKKSKQTTNPLHKKLLEKRISEMIFLEKHRTNREYFLFVYNKDEMKLKQKVNQIKNVLARSNPVTFLSAEKKISILFQMANPNTKPL